MVDIEFYLIVSASLLVLSVLFSKTAGRFGVPALLVFLGVGIMAGSEGMGGIHFDDPLAAQTLGVVALIFILFAGGLETQWKSIRPVFASGILLSTVGIFLTCLLTGLFATYVLKLELLEGLLLGAIVSSTDAAAVFTVLRGKGLNLKDRIRPLLELESGSNDPMAVFLTVGILQLMSNEETRPLTLIPLFFNKWPWGP